MNKKHIILLSVALALGTGLLLCQIAYGFDILPLYTKFEQVVNIDGVGTICVPETWECSIVNGFVFLSTNENGERKHALVQNTKRPNLEAPSEENVYFADVVGWELIDAGRLYSNSAEISKYELQYADGTVSEVFLLELMGRGYATCSFVCLDTSIPMDTLNKIARSFST